MDITPNQLKEPEYILLDELDHRDIYPFVISSLKATKWIYYGYNAYTIAYFLLLICLAGLNLFRAGTGLSAEFAYFAYGLAGSLLLIPLHELIHGLAYRYVGARQTSYDMNLKKFYFMAMADKYVANFAEFRIVALAPFVAISMLCLLCFPFLNGLWIYTGLGVLLTHTLFCSGDFGLMSYFISKRGRIILTYDDKAAARSYFYERISDSNTSSNQD